MLPKAISVFYRHSLEGQTTLAFAIDLLTLVHADKLILFLEQDLELPQVLSVSSPDQLQAQRLFHRVTQEYPLLPKEKLEVRLYSRTQQKSALVADSLLVERRPELRMSERMVPFMVPFDELGLCQRGSGPLILPFGDGRSGLRAANLAFPLAQKLALPVVLYHTSWLEPGVTSSDPADHICLSARKTREDLLTMASEFGLQCKVVLETTDDTVEGIVQCAMRSGARLIAMARRLKPGIGCYVMRALKKSPVPLLVAGDNGKGSLA